MTSPDNPDQDVNQPEPAENSGEHTDQGLAADLKSNLGIMPTWAWMAGILTIAIIGAIAFGVLFMGPAKTSNDQDEAPPGIITPTYPAATTAGKYDEDEEADEPGVDNEYGYQEPQEYYEEPEQPGTEWDQWEEPDEPDDFDEDEADLEDSDDE